MALASLRDLFGYNAWANGRVWSVAADLNEEQMDRPFEMGEGSLRKTLAHIYGAERAWYERCGGPDANQSPNSRDTYRLAEIRDASARLSKLRDKWLAELTDTAMQREITYAKNGRTYAHPLSDVLLHVCNHGMHHRAQALNMLRRSGKKCPTIDVLAMRIKEPNEPAMRTDTATLRAYYEYTDWANGEVFDIAQTLSDAQLRREFEMGMGCILKTLAHIRDAEQWWYENWHNGGVYNFDQIQPDTTIQQLRGAYQQTIDNRNKYMADLKDNDVDRTVQATPSEGQTWTFTLGESMLQLCGHGTHHRAQVINMFRHLGTEVPTLDYIAMKRQASKP